MGKGPEGDIDGHGERDKRKGCLKRAVGQELRVVDEKALLRLVRVAASLVTCFPMMIR